MNNHRLSFSRAQTRFGRGAAFFLLALLSLSIPGRGQQKGTDPVVLVEISPDQVFPSKAIVQLPAEKKKEDGTGPIHYPPDLVAEAKEGTVIMRLLIGADGRVQESKILEDGGNNRLLRAATDGLYSAGFIPGMLDGKPTAMEVLVKVRFAVTEQVSNGGVKPLQIDQLNSGADTDTEMDGFVPYAERPSYDPVELYRLLVYPQLARDNYLEGQVTVSVQIDSTGKPLRAVIRSSSHKIFEENTKKAVLKLAYTPGSQSGKNVESWLTFRVDFKLNEETPASLGAAPERDSNVAAQPETTQQGEDEYGMDDFVPDVIQPNYNPDQLRGLLEYPSVAKSNGIEGKVTLSVQVDASGKPIQVVLRSSSNRVFEKAALDAAWKLKYTPAIKDGKPVKMWLTFAIDFRLDG